jgi:hypothetical protein
VVDDDAITCTADGAAYERVTCELGCNDEPVPHCRYIEPRYLADVCDIAALDASLVIESSGTLDPQLSSNCNGGIVAQTGAPTICVLRYRTITINEGSTLRILDSVPDTLGNAVALIADDDP